MKTLKLTSIILFSFLLLSLKIGDIKNEYKVPFVNSVTSNDLDFDGDIDLIFGHNYNFITEWGGISFLDNLGYGYYYLLDSVFLYGGQTVIYSANIIGDEYPEIVGQYYDGQQSNAAIIEINNGNYDISYYPMCENLTHFNIGDISGNNSIDFAFISNNDYLWGIIYNDGTGNFSEPEYYDLDYPPLNIACADFNDDGRDDVVIADYIIEVYFSTENGFEQQLLGYAIPWSSGYKILPSDFDNDGDIDVIVTATSNSNHSNVYMFENLGNNQFYEHPYFEFTPFCSYAQISDFNNDSLPDIIFIDWDHSELIIYYNIGGFQLEYDQNIDVDNLGYQLGSLDCNDFDGNGFNDIVTIISTQMTLPYNVIILFNDGEGNFLPDPITNSTEISENITNIKTYPNPFNDKVNFDFSNIQCSEINLSIYNVQGSKVFDLTTKCQKGCNNLLSWNACDFNNNQVEPGTYIAFVQIDENFYKLIKLIKN